MTQMTPSGMEPATFWLAAQYLNQLHHCVPRSSCFPLPMNRGTKQADYGCRYNSKVTSRCSSLLNSGHVLIIEINVNAVIPRPSQFGPRDLKINILKKLLLNAGKLTARGYARADTRPTRKKGALRSVCEPASGFHASFYFFGSWQHELSKHRINVNGTRGDSMSIRVHVTPFLPKMPSSAP
jgi:hypothetical protein